MFALDLFTDSLSEPTTENQGLIFSSGSSGYIYVLKLRFMVGKPMKDQIPAAAFVTSTFYLE